MKLKALMALAGLVVLAGCNDSVPKVDDPRNIVVDGQPMTARAFVEKYCAGKEEHETCLTVRRAMVADATKSKSGAPRF